MTSEIDRDKGDKDKNAKQISQGPYTLAKNSSFQITTLACSTKLTHNSNVPFTTCDRYITDLLANVL